MHMKKIWRRTYLRLLGLLVAGCSFSLFSNVQAAETATKNWIDEILSWVVADEFNKQDIVTQFCNAMTWALDEDSKAALQQSLFVAMLCTNGKHDSELFEKANNLIKENVSYRTLGFQSTCQKTYKENCDVAELADNLLTQILSELFTLREAVAFGIAWPDKDFSNGGTVKEWKEAFIKEYLGVDDSKKFCEWGDHKKTCEMLDKQMKQFKKSIKNIKFINLEKLFGEKSECKDDNTRDNSKNNIVYCWAVWEVDGWLNMFTNLVYNEIEWYSIFASFYWQILSQRSQVEEDIRIEYGQSLLGPEKFLMITEESIKDLLNISLTYPMHVVLVAFQEDMLRVRDKYLVKVVTPIYCLYHKLRNVQFDK